MSRTRAASGAALRLGVQVVRHVLPRAVPLPDVGRIPEGSLVDLPGRGETFVIDEPGPTPDAPVVLLFHGLAAGAHLTWFPTIDVLARRYRVIAFDQRWHGRGIAAERFLLADCTDDAAALLDTLGVDDVVVAGYSMGGALAQVFALRHPERVRGLVLCSTAMRWHGNAADRGFFRVLGAVEHWWHDRALASVRSLQGRLPRLPEPPLRDSRDDLRAWLQREFRSVSPWTVPVVLAELGRFDSSGWIHDVQAPTAVVVTARDRAILTSRQRELADTIEQAEVFEAPGGHTSLVFDLDRWQPVFLDAIATVTHAATHAQRPHEDVERA